MKSVQQLTIVTLIVAIVATGCEFRPFSPTGYVEPTREPAAAPTLPPEPGPKAHTLEAVQSEVEPGKKIDFIGEGFTPSELILMYLENKDGKIMSPSEVRTDTEGALKGTLDGIPSYSPPGEWKLVALDEATGVSAEDTLTLLPILPPEKAIQFAQMGVPPGGVMAFTASGFTAKETLTLQITRPDKTEIEHKAYADAYGKLDGTITVPGDRPSGLYQVSVTGTSSGHQAVGWFSVDTIFYGQRAWWNLLQSDEVLEYQAGKDIEIRLGDLLDSSIDGIKNCIPRSNFFKCWITPDGKLMFKCYKIGETKDIAVQVDAWGPPVEYRWVFLKIKCVP